MASVVPSSTYFTSFCCDSSFNEFILLYDHRFKMIMIILQNLSYKNLYLRNNAVLTNQQKTVAFARLPFLFHVLLHLCQFIIHIKHIAVVFSYITKSGR